MAHADKAPQQELGGKPARLLLEVLRERCLEHAVASVVVVPLFFGPTLAATKKIPEALKEVRRRLICVCALGASSSDISMCLWGVVE
jgi:sirohydrochlorin ferrochelatase